MEVFDYRDSVPLDYQVLFPAEILDDPWIVYHGTSAAREADIDAHGIRAAHSIADAATIERVVRLFEALDWGGVQTGGYPVLAGFSSYDVSQGRPIYLAESAARATTFAAADFAGGEAARAMHYALEDLTVFLSGECPADLPATWQTPERTATRLDLVKSTLEGLADLRTAIRGIREAHTHGVVYAVELVPADLLELRHSTSMGLMINQAIPVERLVAKATLPADVQDHRGQDNQRFRFVTEGALLAYLELADVLRAVMPESSRTELAGALTAAVSALEEAGATAELVRSVAQRMKARTGAE